MKISGIIILFFFTMTYTQSLTIHKTDQTTVSFELTAIDSFTISTAAISKILAASDWTSLTAEQAVTEFDKESDICMEGDESLRIYGNGARQPKAIRRSKLPAGCSPARPFICDGERSRLMIRSSWSSISTPIRLHGFQSAVRLG
jgi:hypothetical protein